jgi:hypothetical protein
MEAIYSAETSADFYLIAQPYDPKDHNLKIRPSSRPAM